MKGGLKLVPGSDNDHAGAQGMGALCTRNKQAYGGRIS